MSQDLEKNKIFAALLVAMIVAMLSGFVAAKIFEQHELEATAIEIDTSALESAASGGAAPAGPEPVLALLANADTKKGEALSKACLACHTFDNGGANKVGPNLYGIVNAPKAHHKEFAYSDTLKGMAAKGETWTYQNLNHFLWKPAGYAPGTKMAFPGLKKAQDRADVIAYLRNQAGSAAALPTDADIAAEAPETKQIEQSAATPAEADKVKSAAHATADAVAKEKELSTVTERQPAGGKETIDAKKENVDEAQADDDQKAVTGEKAVPTQDATQNDQSRGDKATQGAGNPALKPMMGAQ